MKKIMIAMFLFAGTSILSNNANAQISVNINIGSQPAWGPTGYDHADFYYLPEANAYYDISRAQFVYLNGKSWIYGKSLPSKYRNINLDNTYKVVVNRPIPYKNNQDDIRQYGKYKTSHNQPIIRNSKDSKYFASYQHPNHDQWQKDQKEKDQRGNGHGKNDNRGNHNRR